MFIANNLAAINLIKHFYLTLIGEIKEIKQLILQLNLKLNAIIKIKRV